MESVSEVACVNCGAVCSTSFCGNCGQQSAVKQLKWSTLFYELNQRWIGLDNKFAKTIRDLTLRPEKVLRAFIQGNRVKYVGPVGYYFVLTSLYVILISLLNIDMVKFSEGFRQYFVQEGAHRTEPDELQKLMMADMRLMSFITMPFAILATHLLFLRKGYNIIETASVIFYASGHTILLSIFSLIIYKFFEVETITFIMLTTTLYLGYAFARFYKGNKVWSFVKGLFSHVLTLILFMVFVLIIGLIFVLIDPDMVKEFLKVKPQ